MKIIINIIMIISILMASTPIHDKFDIRILGKSFGGSLDDNIANTDGLGSINLQHHTGTTEINNELKVVKILKKVEKSTPDTEDKSNLKSSLLSGLIGTNEQKVIIENIETNTNLYTKELSL